MKDFSKQLEKLADVAVKVGVNVQKGQRLLLRRVNLSAAPLVQAIARAAYKVGAKYVDVQWEDEATRKIRHEHADTSSFDHYPQWQADALNEYAREGDAILAIDNDDPDLLAGHNPEHINKERIVKEKLIAPFRKEQKKNAINWSIVSWPSPAWAAKMFPEDEEPVQMQKLLDLIMQTSRVHMDDPVAHWREHAANLRKRATWLNQKQYRYLHYLGPGTDLKIGLPIGHRWMAAESETSSGITFVANIPTEEIFTLPHKDETEGVVRCSKPLNYQGNVIEDFTLTFKQGRVVGIEAARGKELLEHMITADKGAARLGEVALVPHDSPIAQSGVLFYNTLFDENAASHIALGAAYPFCLEGGSQMSDDEFEAAGGNNSIMHVDFMIGSEHLSIDGETLGGKREPLMRDGVWAFEL